MKRILTCPDNRDHKGGVCTCAPPVTHFTEKGTTYKGKVDTRTGRIYDKKAL